MNEKPNKNDSTGTRYYLEAEREHKKQTGERTASRETAKEIVSHWSPVLRRYITEAELTEIDCLISRAEQAEGAAVILKAQRDQLLAALRRIADVADWTGNHQLTCTNIAKAAIANAERGGK